MTALSIVTTVFAILVFAPSLAHALEYPGKMRLDRDAYLRVQKIYYPGFTIAGLAEPFSILACGVFLYLYRDDASIFPLAAAAFVMLILTHAIYWIMTHPVNGSWLAEEQLGHASEAFFDSKKSKRADLEPDNWLALRDRWECSHIIRSVASGLAVLALLCALAA